MEIKLDVDATGRGDGKAQANPFPYAHVPKVRVGAKGGHSRIAALKLEADALQISPHSPLVSTALKENGWVFGQNTHGQLGVGHKNDVEEPKKLSSHRWKALSIGETHAAGVGDGGEVYTWGCNDKGQLGAQGGPRAGTWDVPRRMELLYGWDVRAISCGAEHTVAITPQDVITWGSNEYGQCGHGERAEFDWVKPRSLKILQGQMVTQVVCGRFHTLCVTATSAVYSWGRNHCGQLGHGDTVERRSPAVISALWALPVLQLAAGDSHSAALTSNGFLFTWGGNDKGQLGLPIEASVAQQAAASRTASERRRIVRRVNQRFLQAMMDMGIPEEQAELALAETGNVGVEVATEWLFSVPADVLETHLSGDPETPTASLDLVAGCSSECGASVVLPRRVPLQGVRAMATGWKHTVAVTDEEVFSWGDNTCGQLGHRTFKNATYPTEVKDMAGKGVYQVTCGSSHTIFVCRDSSVYGCGDVGNGVLPLEDPDPAVCLAALSIVDDTADDSDDMSEACSAAIADPFLMPALSMADISTTGRSDSSGVLLRYISAPTIVDLNFLAGDERVKATVVTQAVAGARSSAFLTRAADELPDVPPPRLWEKLVAAVATAHEAQVMDPDAHIQPIASAVERVFGSAAAISAAFGISDAVGLEATLLDSVQRSILELEPAPAPKLGDPQPERDDLYQALRRGMEALILELEHNVRLLGTPERAQVLLAALQSPLLGDSRCSNSLIPRVCNIVLAAPSSCRHLLVRWWADYSGELLEHRVVKPLQRYLTDELYATKKLTVSVMNAIKVLAQVEEANQMGRKLPPEAFYNELISEKLDVLDHYVAWRQTHDMPQHTNAADGPFSFCSYPFLLNPRAKSKLLHTEARIQMDQTVADARAETGSGRNQSTGGGNGGSERQGSGGGDEQECVVPNLKRRQNNNNSNSNTSGSSTSAVVGGASSSSANTNPTTTNNNNNNTTTTASIMNNNTTTVAAATTTTTDNTPANNRRRRHSGANSSQSHSHGGGGLFRSLFHSSRHQEPGSPTHSDEYTSAMSDAAVGGHSAMSHPLADGFTAAAASPLNEVTSSHTTSHTTGTTTTHQHQQQGLIGSPTTASATNAATFTGGKLWKQGSLGLPTPEESGFPATNPDMCILRVRRGHLVQDALSEVARQRPRDLFKPLRVHFIGEDGVDAGGVKKEFFQLLIAELLCPDYGMMIHQPESNTYWFNPATLEGDEEFLLLGLVVGMAVYNGVLLDLPLPLALYRKILGQEVRLRDLEDMQPTLGRSLRQLLQYEGPGSVADVFCQTFSVEVQHPGETRMHPLCPDGENIMVTEDNRREFVDHYVDWWLSLSIHRQFEAFAKGFLQLCGGPALQLFSATELERLVCGSPCLDFDNLQRAARYEGGYHPEHRVVQWLWQVVAELCTEERKLFLKFVTGSDRAPIGGLANLRMIVQRDGPDSNKLPTSHTCFNTLLLPSYRSKDKLEARLKLAILNSEGFGLE